MQTWLDPTLINLPYYHFNGKLCFEARDLLMNCLDKNSTLLF